MNDLERYVQENSGNLVVKWVHYFEIYDRHFSKYRGTDVHVVEFGVLHGGSLQMWKNYFGPNAKIYGVDINPECKQVEEEQIRVFIGDQGDREFLKSLADAIPRIDILIDDGSHKMQHQIDTFEVLFPHIDKEGIYFCEDIHTSYLEPWGGAHHRRSTFVEFSKNWIDSLHAWFSEQPRTLAVSDFTRSAHSVHYYPNVVVIEKRPMSKPYTVTTGNAVVPQLPPQPPQYPPLVIRVLNKIRRVLNW